MANIKVSEMTEATSFDNGDYTMIVQANQNKKISKENIFSNLENEISTNASDISTINTNIGNLSSLETDDKTSVVSSINELKEREIYSNNEVKTNKIWIDGKPIYRKVFYVSSLPNTGSLFIDPNITYLGYIFNIYGMASTGATINGGRPDGTQYGISAWYEAAEGKIRVVAGTDRSSANAYIIMEYTKTTD